MNISHFQTINEIRATRWHHLGETDWSLLEWCGAMAGETGEACNFAKKIKRLEMALPNKEAGLDIHNLPVLRLRLGREIADSIIYGLIVLSKLDIDASVILKEVFNQKSIEYGFPERAPENE